MTCSEFRGAYSDLADGLLDELSEVAARRHLSECLPCRRFHEAFQWGVRELRRQPQVLPSAAFLVRLERRIEAEHSPVALAVRQGTAAAATLMAFTLVAAGVFAYDIARHAAPPPLATASLRPPPVLGPDPFRAEFRPALHADAATPFRVTNAVLTSGRGSLRAQAVEFAGFALTR